MNVVKPSAISTSQLNPSLGLHLSPIDLVVYQGPSFDESKPRPDLEGGLILLRGFSWQCGIVTLLPYGIASVFSDSFRVDFPARNT
jgi:hypothetical protein